MARIAGVNIPDNKHVVVSLRYVYGIGPVNAMDILKEANIDPMKKARELNEDEVGRIVTVAVAESEQDVRKPDVIAGRMGQFCYFYLHGSNIVELSRQW